MAKPEIPGALPLILSFSPWEKGRLNFRCGLFRGSLSHGERDRVRGDSLTDYAIPPNLPRPRFGHHTP